MKHLLLWSLLLAGSVSGERRASAAPEAPPATRPGERLDDDASCAALRVDASGRQEVVYAKERDPLDFLAGHEGWWAAGGAGGAWRRVKLGPGFGFDALFDARGSAQVTYLREGRVMLATMARGVARQSVVTHVGDDVEGALFSSGLSLDARGKTHLAFISAHEDALELRYATNASGAWRVEPIKETLAQGAFLVGLTVDAIGVRVVDVSDGKLRVARRSRGDRRWTFATVAARVGSAALLARPGALHVVAATADRVSCWSTSQARPWKETLIARRAPPRQGGEQPWVGLGLTASVDGRLHAVFTDEAQLRHAVHNDDGSWSVTTLERARPESWVTDGSQGCAKQPGPTRCRRRELITGQPCVALDGKGRLHVAYRRAERYSFESSPAKPPITPEQLVLRVFEPQP